MQSWGPIQGRLWEFHHQGRPGSPRDAGKLRKGRRYGQRAQVPGRDGRGGGGGCRAPRGAETGLSRTRRGCWEAPTPRALAVPRLLSPEKVPAGQGKKALARLTWGRPTCCKAWDPGCQRILTAAGSETRGPRHLGVLHASPAAPRKGGRGGARGADKLGGAWLADAGSTGPVWPSPGRNTQQLRGRRRAVRVGGRAGCAVWPRVARRRSRLSQTWREGAL